VLGLGSGSGSGLESGEGVGLGLELGLGLGLGRRYYGTNLNHSFLFYTKLMIEGGHRRMIPTLTLTLTLTHMLTLTQAILRTLYHLY
jgi:hypothetical protein